jgi:hypothetical protein
LNFRVSERSRGECEGGYFAEGDTKRSGDIKRSGDTKRSSDTRIVLGRKKM